MTTHRLRHRSRMAGRVFTAFVGGYAATSGTAALTARILPVDRVEATVWAMILSFALYGALILWIFHEPRLGRVALVTWGLAVGTIGTAWLLGARP